MTNNGKERLIATVYKLRTVVARLTVEYEVLSTPTKTDAMWKSSLILAVVAIAVLGKTTSKKKVCVVGAGPPGLTTIKFLTDYPHKFECVAFEKKSDISDMWIFTNSSSFKRHMAMRDKYLSLIKHSHLLQYLRNYTEYYKLRQYIQFNIMVEKVLPLSKFKWVMNARDLKTRKLDRIVCNAIILATGHFVKGYSPVIRGIGRAIKKQLRTHLYRELEKFTNQTFLMLDTSYSGRMKPHSHDFHISIRYG
ncbi:uncharacterized protein LOC131664674 [Phymastichus coffea]|uniref:uncharacterized protein LOC131664674 n=1 Tax=Phymastichus coffea TaxID=108790 RepID=UPI00273C0D16|nr:uncharacterized protein LOC131664674 [Phymastichus coffea]